MDSTVNYTEVINKVKNNAPLTEEDKKIIVEILAGATQEVQEVLKNTQ